MIKKCLIDAGPMIALFDKSDKYHKKILSFMKKFRGTLFTTWQVITEVSYMLNFNIQTQLDFMQWIDAGAVTIRSMSNADINRIIELTNQYRDVPMDLADASLIIISEKENIQEIISIDSDFNVYRSIKNKYIKNIFSYMQ